MPANVPPIHDRGFVRGSPDAVFRMVSTPAHYGRWWPRVASRPVADGGAELVLAGFGRLRASVRDLRPRVGLFLDLAGPRARATLEWYLEPFKAGTVANALLVLDDVPGWGRRREAAYRSAIRAGLVALSEGLDAPAWPGRQAVPGDAR